MIKRKTLLWSWLSFLNVALLMVFLGDYPLMGFASEIMQTRLRSANKYFDNYELGLQKMINGEFLVALDYFSSALNTARSEGNLSHELDAYMKKALMLWNLGRIKDSIKEYYGARTVADKLKSKDSGSVIAKIILIAELYTKAKDLRAIGEYKNSTTGFEKAIELAKEIGSREHELKCLRQLSLNYWDRGEAQTFYALNQAALEIARKLNHKQEEGRCLNNIGLYYLKIENYMEALRHYEISFAIANDSADFEELANTSTNLGIIYMDLGNYERALDYLNRTLEIDKKLGNPISISMDLNNIGSLFRRKGITSELVEDFALAKKYFDNALDIIEKIGINDSEVTRLKMQVLNNRGTVSVQIGDFARALEYFKAALDLATQIGISEDSSVILNNIGIVYSQLGNFEASTDYYQRAIDLALSVSEGNILWEPYLEIADSYKKQGKWDAALESYRKSISVIENIRSGISTEELKATYLGSDKRIDAYYNIIDLYVLLSKMNQDEALEAQAFDYLEKAKARAFLDSIEVSKINLSAGIDQRLLNRETELMNDISHVHTRLLAPRISPEQRTVLTAELSEFENDLDLLKQEIREASPAYADLKYPLTVTLTEAQRYLIDESTACFAYLLGKDNSYAFAIYHNDLKIYRVPKKQDIQRLAQEHLRAISDPAVKDFRTSYELFELLIKPGLKQGVRNIIIIPDDVLYLLPFETLMTKAEGSNWLINAFSVAYIPSLSSLRELVDRDMADRHGNPKKDILAIGDPDYGASEIDDPSQAGVGTSASGFDSKYQRLRYSGQEVKEIVSLFKSQRTDTLLRDEATEENFKSKRLSDYKVLHFAAHAVIDDKKPSRSSIVLNLDQDPAEDGFIQMREVFNLQLSADLVVLSACETGLGRLIKGEGIEGLNRAFFYAGASSVLLSLWAINDQASYQLLERFYVHLRSSNSIMDALRRAKLEMIESGVLAHPYYWAGFIVTGEADKVIFPRNLIKWIIATLSLATGVAILLFYVNRDRPASFSAKFDFASPHQARRSHS